MSGKLKCANCERIQPLREYKDVMMCEDCIRTSHGESMVKFGGPWEVFNAVTGEAIESSAQRWYSVRAANVLNAHEKDHGRQECYAVRRNDQRRTWS